MEDINNAIALLSIAVGVIDRELRWQKSMSRSGCPAQGKCTWNAEEKKAER